jgi:formylglycine-generating enzyme required for sulfatase activity
LSNGDSSTASGPQPHDLFIDLERANVGFKHWHPISVAEKGEKLCGQADLGGAWEWTSTALDKHAGFEAMPLYPGYTGIHGFSCNHGRANSGSRLLRWEAQRGAGRVVGYPSAHSGTQDVVSAFGNAKTSVLD